MARSGINIRMKKNGRLTSLDVIYDLSDFDFRNWVLSKIDYRFGMHKLTVAERYKVIEDMQEGGIRLFIDRDSLQKEDWWNGSSKEPTSL